MATNWNANAAMISAGVKTGNAVTSTMGSYRVNNILAGMQAETYRTQARLRLMEAEREDAYINETFAHEVWNVGDRAISARASSNAFKGASGFDISAGDIREQRALEYAANREAAGINRTAYLQSFENQMQARLEATRLEYAAKSQDAIKKFNSKSRGIAAGFFAGLGAFASSVGDLGAAGAFGGGKSTNVSPTQGGGN